MNKSFIAATVTAAVLSATVVGLSAVKTVEAVDQVNPNSKPVSSFLWEHKKTVRMPQPKPVKKTSLKPVKRAETHNSRKPVDTRKPVDPKPAPKTAPKPSGVTISSYAWCPGNAQACIDAGKLTGYNGRYIAGHDYMGYAWLNSVPVGTTVSITNGPLAGTYRVYGHLRLNRQGGSFPSTPGADLVMQSCSGSGTGFSLARRI